MVPVTMFRRPAPDRCLHRLILVAVALLVGTMAVAVGSPVTTAALSTAQNGDAGLIGWDGDRYAVETHLDGSYRVLMTNISYGFGIYQGQVPVQWYPENGYLPALTSQFESGTCTVRITNFGDKVTIGGHDFVAVYSRVSVYNTVPPRRRSTRRRWVPRSR